MIKKIISLFVAWRILLFLAAAIGAIFLPFTPRFPYADIFLVPSELPAFIWSFANFDGVHYITIVSRGYEAQFTQVFFPFYPLLVKFLSLVLFDQKTIISGLIVSNITFLTSLIVFAKLLRLDYTKRQTYWILLFLLAFPTAFYFGSYYSESIFFLLTIGSFYAGRKKKWWLAGLLGGLASFTRIVGIFLLPALIWEWYKEFKKQKNMLSFFKFPPLYLMPLGLIIYMVYLHFAYGDWLYFWHAQPVFGAQRSGSAVIFLPQVIFRYIKILTSNALSIESFFIPLLELFATISALCLLFIAWKKGVRISYVLFSLLATVIPTLTGTFSSMPRYILVAFPLYIVLGTMHSIKAKIALLVISLILSVCLVVLFTRGVWVS